MTLFPCAPICDNPSSPNRGTAMRRVFLAAVLLAGAGVCAFFLSGPRGVEAQPAKDAKPSWVWTSDATVSSAPDGTRYFRKTFEVKGDVKEASLGITVDNHFTVWVNEKQAGTGDEWQYLQKLNVAKLLKPGKNVIAVEGRNDGGSPAGLLASLVLTDADGKRVINTDKTWKAAEAPGDGWRKADFDEAKWEAANVLAPLGEGPWGNFQGGGTAVAPKQRGFTVPEGFRVETVVAPGTKIEGEDNERFKISFVNMTFDAKGRLLLAQEGGPVVLALDPDKNGQFQKLVPYCEQIKNCHGMCWVRDALYLVGDGPKGTGLYRCRDTKGVDRIDSVEIIHKFKGGMGEHGPHAVVHGPDDKLYVVIGNHAFAQVDKLAENSPLKRWPTGGMGPDQGKPGTTEDVLLPRLNDANGHAANILAPGGTIWRMDLDGKNPALVAAGFRNHFDAAFNPEGELFTFDSDMEWDEGLPWYRPVRVAHCTPGADFVWRTGAANTPNYYPDSLPPTVETGRGSPTGVEFYDHAAFPAKYRGAFFMCDWSIGTIWVVHLQRAGATYKGQAEKFCSGAPMPVSDCAVAPDGELFFTLGGRGTQGSVHRIVHAPAKRERKMGFDLTIQPLAPYVREAWRKDIAERGPENVADIVGKKALDPGLTGDDRLIELRLAATNGVPLPPEVLVKLTTDKVPAVRAMAVRLLGQSPGAKAAEPLTAALADSDALVRRRACEALVRAGAEPPVKDLKPLLADEDRFLRTAARLVLQRIDTAKWADDLLADKDDRIVREAIIALCKIDRAVGYAGKIFPRLEAQGTGGDQAQLHDWARVVQLALIHTKERPAAVKEIARQCEAMFPGMGRFLDREVAILLAEFARTGVLKEGVVTKLMAALKASKDDRPQQIHYFYCLRLINDGWTPEQKQDLLAWYESTRSWTGGASYSGFLQNILKDASDVYTPAERVAVIEKAGEMPQTALAFLRFSTPEQLPPAEKLDALYKAVKPNQPRANELKAATVEALGKSIAPEAQAALRRIADTEPGQRLTVARALSRFPTAENLPYLIKGLAGAQGGNVAELLDALKRNPAKPKPDDAAAFRAVILASGKLPVNQKWKVIEVLRHWTGGKSFGAEKKEEWKHELTSWGRWYAQTFPKEPSLPDVASDKPAESKYKFAELVAYLEKDPRGTKGDVAKGKLAFTKANCVKCHKYGPEGEGIGPDLSTLAKRFKRSEVLEAIVEPSKVISDQYRSSQITTLAGKSYIGLAAEQGGTITILLQDGTKETIKASDVDTRFASLVSVMPEKLLDELTKEEIADLFAYLESPVPDKK